jgi:hypothetical protein
MAYIPIDLSTIKVGDPIKKELLDLVRNNFEDHESRIQIIAGGSGKIALINEDAYVLANASGLLTGCFYVEVIQACIITEGSIQLFAKANATSGTLTVDVKKNTTTNPSGFNSVFSTPPTLNLAVVADYSKNAGIINPAAQALAVGDILRVDITALPTALKRFRINLIGEF